MFGSFARLILGEGCLVCLGSQRTLLEQRFLVMLKLICNLLLVALLETQVSWGSLQRAVGKDVHRGRHDNFLLAAGR